MPTVIFNDTYEYEFSEYDSRVSKIIRQASEELFDDETAFETSENALEDCIHHSLNDIKDALYDDAYDEMLYYRDRYSYYGLSRSDF